MSAEHPQGTGVQLACQCCLDQVALCATLNVDDLIRTAAAWWATHRAPILVAVEVLNPDGEVVVMAHVATT